MPKTPTHPHETDLTWTTTRPNGSDQDITHLTSPVLTQAGFLNAFSTRGGGVSPFPTDALHLGDDGDTEENITENRRRFFAAVGWRKGPCVTVRQVHGATVRAVTSQAGDGDGVHADALVTNETGTLLGIKTADCLPILLADPVAGAWAAVHAGWRGTVAGVTNAAVQTLLTRYGAEPGRILAVFGPHACGRCLEVGEEVGHAFDEAFPGADAVSRDQKGKVRISLKNANAWALRRAGVFPTQMQCAASCTLHDAAHFFSHRRAAKSGPVGRMLAVLGRVSI